MVFLRGNLFIHVLRAKRLYNADGLFKFSKNKSDPYVKVKIGDTTIAKTRVLQNTLDPKWDEYYLIEVCHEGETLDLQVLDEDLVGEDDLGILQIPLDRLIDRKQIEGEYYLTRKGRKCTGRILFNVTLYSIDDLDRTRAVQNCYFEQRRNCKVTLYQDACADSNILTDGLGYKRARAWDDIVTALDGAKDFIYITGWSVKATTKLKRDGDGRSVGELLKGKADDGVKVLLLIWNEVTSTSITSGLIGTFDQETLQYFAGSRVKCVLLSREKKSKNIVESSLSATVYSHHQKTIVCDTDGSYVKRRVIAFIGGLDLTEGRYDTPEHPLFQTLTTDHASDFYNVSAALENTACGPRQPWHDIHAKLEGAAALDIKQNFEERWTKQSEQNVRDLVQLHDLAYDLQHKYHEENKWNVQIFRSVCDNSAHFGDEKRRELLTRRTDTLYENTIHKAYVHHIRRAKHFIYIENQYFLGSCHMWNNETGPEKAVQLIPITITMRIIDAINNDEDFSVYIVIPLHPEGDPASIAIQEMLWYQYSTIRMMYGFIGDALKGNGSEKLPTDYLSFFCLGKREPNIPDDLEVPGEGTKEEALRRSARFMIYVHSKMAIFDDEYIIVGSANINQRSMSGKRDTEIAMGACQANKKADEGLPNGEIANFRKSLFIEHLNKREAVWEDTPASTASVRAVREEALNNWNSYVSDSDQPDGHLLLYPYEVTADGQVTTRTDCFPDTEAKIIGSEDAILVEKITT